jgi:hypothetical protein
MTMLRVGEIRLSPCRNWGASIDACLSQREQVKRIVSFTLEPSIAFDVIDEQSLSLCRLPVTTT